MKKLSQSELEITLPLDKVFAVAIDGDGYIIQHPTKERVFLLEDKNEYEDYYSKLVYGWNEPDSLWIFVPNFSTTEEIIEYIDSVL